jgi:dienelactone hydrolase
MLKRMTRREWMMLSSASAFGQTVHEEIQGMAKSAPLAMRYSGASKEQCVQWQREFKAKLDSLLGSYAPPTRWKSTVTRKLEFDDHTREELILRAEGHRDLPVHLLVPRGRSGRRPGIVALHGHGTFGNDPVAGVDDTPERQKNIAAANYDYGRQLVRKGYVVAAPCFTPFGARLGKRESYRGDDPCAVTFVRMQLFGKLLLGENLRDALWAIELVASHDQVDAQRIGCVGLSLGGRMTMMTAAVSPRVRVAVISGALNMLQERVLGRYSCGAQIVPGLLNYGDVPEISSLIAPRPCLFEVGRQDSLMVKEWIPPALERMRRAWSSFGADSDLDVDSFEGGHRWSGVKAYPLLARVLQP